MLGRGGSDTTAVALGAALNAKVKIFTDVNGFYTCDPNKFKGAKLLKKININSALNLANAGAKVLDKRSLMLANKYKVNLEVLKSMHKHGTQIEYGALEGSHIDGVSHTTDLFLLKGEPLNIPASNIKKHLYLSENGTPTEYTIFSLSANAEHPQNATPCELVCVAGSGLDTFDGFTNKLLKPINTQKTCPYLIDISPSAINIITKKGSAKKLAEKLINVIYG